MKKTIFSFLILIVIGSTQMFSQGTRFGFKMGLNRSEISDYQFTVVNVDGETPIEPFSTVEEGRIAFTASFFAEIPLTNSLSLQPEFGFSGLGNKFDGVRYDHLQLPVALRANFNKLFVLVGPQASIKISAFRQSEDFKSLDFAAFGGVGYHFNDNFFFEARYTKGFAEIFEDDSMIRLPIASNDPDDGITPNGSNFLAGNSGTNAYFTFTVGYKL